MAGSGLSRTGAAPPGAESPIDLPSLWTTHEFRTKQLLVQDAALHAEWETLGVLIWCGLEKRRAVGSDISGS
jgi:hypothetical protein